jgi:hypothetical protein
MTKTVYERYREMEPNEYFANARLLVEVPELYCINRERERTGYTPHMSPEESDELARSMTTLMISPHEIAIMAYDQQPFRLMNPEDIDVLARACNTILKKLSEIVDADTVYPVHLTPEEMEETLLDGRRINALFTGLKNTHSFKTNYDRLFTENAPLRRRLKSGIRTRVSEEKKIYGGFVYEDTSKPSKDVKDTTQDNEMMIRRLSKITNRAKG